MSNTIAAIATPPGTGGVAIVRVSGLDAFAIAAQVTSLKNFTGNTIRPCAFTTADGQTVLDHGLLAVFTAPRSYTGEDTVELNCHGSDYLARRLLSEVLVAGARLAEPGEFTKRAFLSGKLDLTQAESVADMLSAGGNLSLNLALQHLDGDVSREIRRLRREILQILAEIEAALDYPEEIADPDTEKIRQILGAARETTARLLADSDAGLLIKSGAQIVLAGRPNVGKSSLFNALLKHNRAIVTDIAGTTRDALEAEADIGGLKVTLLDTAGLRETTDPLERLGVERSRACLQNADLVLAIFDAASREPDADEKFWAEIKHLPHLRILNKIDLLEKVDETDSIPISAKNGVNLDLLGAKILEKLNLRRVDFSRYVYVSSLRQKNKLIQAAKHLEKCLSALGKTNYLDVLAPYLKAVAAALGEITGDEVSEEIIEQIFANFCVGK
ncbi:tRNA modification GTPase MnmE [Candidatus Termititenax persephonae]|uniref:tRNA modification GTPase MnmE n=1 Tax=Candidatus Termititenax persephonae TaxID=2218525 RepID=A0A388TI46_9BACT|nr:tRNA modification GTPase MnmE [Candidatus Termititenax persephonae]